VGTTGAPGPTVTTNPPGTPTLSPTPPPVLTGTHAQPNTHPQLPITIPSHDNGGGSLGGLSKRPPVKLDSGAANGGSGLTLVPTAPGFLGPKAWTGTVTTNPALTGALGNLADLLANGNTPPRFLIPIYMEAGRRYHVPWQVLAAINAVESDFGRNLNTSSAGAIGWMQFEPSTWKQYGLAVDGHSVPNPYDPRDAIFSAARYLAAAGAAQDVSRAIFAYNHATWYVNMVLTRARAIAAGVHPYTQTSKHGVVSAYFASWHGHWRGRYKGGLLSHYDRLIAAANMVSAANFPYVYAGGHEQPARFEPFDCSGSVSYVVQQAGYKVPTTASGGIPNWKFPAGPGRVTIFYNPGHTFMRIGNRYFGTSGFARPGGGAGWFNTGTIPASYLAGFNEVHVPRLGSNSFAPGKHHKHAAPAKHSTHIAPAKHSTHTAPTKHPRYLQQFAPSAPLRASFPSVLQLRFPSA
jgi:cell wall-associated NlpC family hydrolase